MTAQDLTKEIRLPIWMVTALIVIAMALLGFMWKQAVVQGQVIEQVKQLRTDFDTHVLITRSDMRSKADVREMDQVYEALRRIENKLQ